jgi:hypothetical protein
MMMQSVSLEAVSYGTAVFVCSSTVVYMGTISYNRLFKSHRFV